MAAKNIKFEGFAVVTLRYEDDKVEIFGVSALKEHPDGSLEIEHGDKVTKVRPTYRLYELGPDPEEENE